jgi:CHAT domain-containing protein/ATP/ADP translocase/Tfp pilus assembly protein PilF
MITSPSRAELVAAPTAPCGRRERLLRRFTAIEPGEARSVALFFAYAFVLLVCYYILKTLREPLLLRVATPAAKSYAYAAVAVVLFVIVPLYGAVFRRAASSRVAVWITTFFVTNLLGFSIATRLGVDVGFIYYVWVGVFGVTIVAQFWAHAADAFAVGSGQRVFPTIMGGATLGAIAGPVVARALYDVAAPWSLMLIATVLLAATLPLIGWTRDSVPRESRSVARGDAQAHGASAPFGGFTLIFRDRYLLLLAALAVLLNCVNTTGEYILTDIVVRHANEQVALHASLDKGALIAKFYSDYFFVVNALTALTQVLLVGRLFRWIGVQGALLVLPIIAVLGYGLVLVAPVFAILRFVKIAENCADYSIANTARQALFLPLPRPAKYVGKIAIDTFLWRCGDLLQAGIVFVGLHWLGFGVRHFALLNMALGIAWLAVALALARRYSARTATQAPLQVDRAVRPQLGSALATLAATLGGHRAALARGCAAVLLVGAGISVLTGSAPAHADLPPSAAVGRPGLSRCAELVCAKSARTQMTVWPRNLPYLDAYAKLPPLDYKEQSSEALRTGLGGSLRGSSRMTFGGHAVRAHYTARVAAVVALAADGLAVGQPQSLDAAVPIQLREGSAVTAQHQRSGEKIAYAFDATPRATYLVKVEQNGLDFSLSIESPDGDTRAFNSPLFRDEPEFALIEDAKAGRYRLTIVSDEATNAVGGHSITVTSFTPAPPTTIEVWRQMSEGARANKEGRGKDALASYEKAVRLWHDLGDLRREAQATFSAAMVRYWSIYDWEGAAKEAAAAAALYERAGARGPYADAMLVSGYSLMEVAQGAGPEAERAFESALAALRASYSIYESVGDSYGLAQAENYTGLAYYNRGRIDTQDFREAEAHYRHAIELYQQLGEWREQLNSRQNLALISIDEGRSVSAASALEKILADIPDGREPLFRGIVLANLGIAYRDAGEFDSALRALSESLKIHAALNQFNWEGLALRVLGSTYQALGELDRASEYLRQALAKSGDDARVRSSVLTVLGNVAYQKGDYEAALDWHRRAIESTVSASDRANRNAFVARDLVALHRFDGAIEAARPALADESPAITRADAALELGQAYLGLGKPKEADTYFATALSVYDAGGLRAQQAESLRGRALAARASGDYESAIRYGELSLERIEALRTNVGAPELRAQYAAAHRDYYEQQIDLLVTTDRGSPDTSQDRLLTALSVSERGRARMLVDLLAETSIRLDRDVPQAVLDHERELYDELGALRHRRDLLLANATTNRAELDPLVARMAAIENELALSAMDSRKKGSTRTSTPSVAPLTARDIQSSLDERSVLLQYALGTERSFAWVVTRESVRIAELAGRATIEAAARRAQQSLKKYHADRADELGASLRELSDLVLLPLGPILDSHERVIIAADGGLDYIPFGALPIARDGAAVSMLRAAQVVNVPSMSVLAAQRRRTEPPPAKTLAVFADPVFSAADPRLGLDSRAVQPLSSSDTALTRLPASGAEASAIAALVPPSESLVATGLEASREHVLGVSLEEYRFVHFATHGLVDSTYPGLSALAFSQVDASGKPENGSLRLQDIYGLRLNADLVVLSGCETALGREIRGEGLIGLVDGFLYAGARSLVVSLWQVPDRATSELMARFYGYLLKDGARPGEALRRAQISIAAERRWSDPYFWAAFIVLGDS